MERTTQRVRLAIALTLLAVELLADQSRQDRKFVNAALVRYINSTRVLDAVVGHSIVNF